MYWLKQFGRADDDWWQQFVVAPHGHTMEFPNGMRRKPRIHIGDNVIFTGIHVTSLIFAGVCIEEAYPPTHEELIADPWRQNLYWKLDFTNLFPNFAENWSIHNLSPYALADLFLAANPNVPLLHNGSFTLGGLNARHSHLKLSDQFGQFLLQSMQQNN